MTIRGGFKGVQICAFYDFSLSTIHIVTCYLLILSAVILLNKRYLPLIQRQLSTDGNQLAPKQSK